MQGKVGFTAMADGTAADYELIFAHEAAQPDRYAAWILDTLAGMDEDGPYQVSRLEHSLQTATRAERDGADDETVVCALLHDIGDVVAPANHSEVAAAMLKPFVSEKNHWIVKHHGLFQGYYWFQFIGEDRNTRERFRGHEYFDDCVGFCANWDQPSFDPDYDSLPLQHFAPRVEALFAKEPQAHF